jgi:glycosyltransferase involved in cell wall biosynthesis
VKLLVLGPRFHRNGHSGGGVVVLFELFLEELRGNNVDFRVIDTNKKNYESRILSFLFIFFIFFRNVFGVTHVTLHGTANDYKYIAPLVVFIANLLKKKVSLRKFAGNFNEVYSGLGFLSKKLVGYALRSSDVNFFETKYLVADFSLLNQKTYLFPNVRKSSTIFRQGPFRKRFVFLGQVCREKGVCELIEAADSLPDEYQVDIYGQIVESELEEKIRHSKAFYKGSLKPDGVIKKLADYDVLVLPTFWKGEGYPGVIIEAFCAGVPVIATSLDGIKEIVSHGKNGLLVQPKNVAELAGAMRSITMACYPEFSKNAKKSFQQFDSSIATQRFLEAINVEYCEKNL